ncbi:MAG: type II toxin-antitoxin system VapC family toxin [Candidatus Magasanikbacteria bacterium]
MERIVLDTNAVIYYLQNDSKAVSVIENLKDKDLYLSTITETEVFSKQDLAIDRIIKIDTWLSNMSFVPVDSVIARKAASLRREYNLDVPDAIIGATSLFVDATVVSRDDDFDGVDEVEIIKC